jgi:hypothetical protein
MTETPVDRPRLVWPLPSILLLHRAARREDNSAYRGAAIPGDYDGIVGAIGTQPIHLMAGAMWTLAAAGPLTREITPESPRPRRLGDAVDGVTDGVIATIRRRCRFDRGMLLCKGGESAGCLTAPQWNRSGKYMTVQKIHVPASESFPAGR